MQISFIAVGASGLKQVSEIAKRWQKTEWKDRVNWELFYVGSDSFKKSDWTPIFNSIQDKKLVLLDLMGADKEFCQALYSHLEDFTGDIIVLNASDQKIRSLTRIGKFSMKGMSKMGKDKSSGPDSMRKMMKMIQTMENVGKALPIGKLRDMRNYFWFGKYWRFANEKNIEGMFYLLGKDYLGYKDFPAIKPPETIDEVLIFDPVTKSSYKSLKNYLKDVPHNSAKATVGILFSNNNYPVDTFPVLKELSTL